MPTYDTMHDASLFAAVGLLLAIITMRRARPLRKGMVVMVVADGAGPGGARRCWSAYGDASTAGHW